MQDIATLSSMLVDELVTDYGEEGTTYEVLKTRLEGKGLNGIDSSYLYVVDGEGTFLYHKKEDKVGTTVFNDNVAAILKAIPTGKYEENGVFHYVDENGVTKYGSYQVISSTKWVAVIVANENEVMADINTVINASIMLSTVLGLVLLGFSIIAAAGITKPIRILTGVIKQVGDLNFTMSGDLEKMEKNKDETGIMAIAIGEMEQSLRDIVGRISDTSSNLEEHAETLSDITFKIDSANADNSATSQELAASMEETSVSTDLISDNTATIKNKADAIADSALNSSDMAKEISEKAAGIRQDTIAASEKTQKIYEEIDAQGFSDALGSIYNQIGELQESTTEISTSIADISKTVGEAAQAVTTVAEKTTDVAQLSEGVVSVVAETKGNSNELKEIRNSFTI